MKCPKCGKVLQKTENGKYICTPNCKMIYSEKELKDMKIKKEAKNLK